MRIKLCPKPRARGNILIITLVVGAIVSYLLASYLTLAGSQNLATARSQSWNVCIPVLEAGIEEALTHLQYAGMTNLGSDGWTLDSSGTNYVKQRNLGQGFSFTVRISITAPPVITSTGYAPTPYQATNISRTVRCTTIQNGLFMKGMVAKGQIDLKGNNIASNSYDGGNPNYSTNGRYDSNPAKTKDNGDIATNSGLVNSLNVGNADIQGHVSTGPGGTVAIGPNGSVGSKSWVPTPGIQPGYSSDNMNVSFPDVQAPFSSNYSIPAPGIVNGTNYDYILGSGNYELGALSLNSSDKVLVLGNAVLYVPGSVSMQGSSQIQIATNASLAMYVGTSNTNAPTSVSLGGNGIDNSFGTSTNFYFYGLPSTTSLSMSGNASFTGAIYAPEAALTLGGGGNNTYDFAGASVTSTVTLNGHYNFHYDENLGRVGPKRGYLINSWNEYLMYNEI